MSEPCDVIRVGPFKDFSIFFKDLFVHVKNWLADYKNNSSLNHVNVLFVGTATRVSVGLHTTTVTLY